MIASERSAVAALPAKEADFRFGPREWPGALGDAGTLVPILLTLSVLNGIELNQALALSAFAHIGAALWFRLEARTRASAAIAMMAVVALGTANLTLSLAAGWGTSRALRTATGNKPSLPHAAESALQRAPDSVRDLMTAPAKRRKVTDRIRWPSSASSTPAAARTTKTFSSCSGTSRSPRATR